MIMSHDDDDDDDDGHDESGSRAVNVAQVIDSCMAMMMAATENDISNALVMIVGEPFFVDWSQCWAWEHILEYERWVAQLQNEWLRRYPYDDDDKGDSVHSLRAVHWRVRTMAAPFDCEELWSYYAGRIGVVEGVDMSAINSLMEEVDDGGDDDSGNGNGAEIISVRLSQWCDPQTHVCMSSARAIGSISTESLCANRNSASGTQYMSCEIDMTDVMCAHGIVLWVEMEEQFEESSPVNMAHSPVSTPDAIQGIVLFDSPICRNNDDGDGVSRKKSLEIVMNIDLSAVRVTLLRLTQLLT